MSPRNEFIHGYRLSIRMSPGLSEEDLNRIADFVRKPRYAREPDMLLPDAENHSNQDSRECASRTSDK